MTPESYLGHIADLIYTRLDLPPVPTVDKASLTEWMVSNQRSLMNEKKLHDDGRKANYPWRAVHACSENKWDPEFVQRFPDLVMYTQHFPTLRWKRVCVIGQLPDEEVFLHTDPDFGIGWRIYLTHGGPKLYFQKFKERHAERPQTWASGGPSAMSEICKPEKFYVEDSGTYPWALSSIRAAHGVSRNDQNLGDRVTLLLFPEIATVDRLALQSMLEAGASKYADTAIWY